MIKLTLPDGSAREIEAAQSAAEVIKGIGMGLYKAACCVKINGEVCDLRTVRQPRRQEDLLAHSFSYPCTGCKETLPCCKAGYRSCYRERLLLRL